MSERGGEGCVVILYGGLALVAISLVYSAYIRVEQLSSPEARRLMPTVIATAIVRQLAETPVPSPTFPTPLPKEAIPQQTEEEITARLDAYPKGAQFIVVRRDKRRFLVEQQGAYLKIIQWLDGEPGWADRVLLRHVIAVY